MYHYQHRIKYIEDFLGDTCIREHVCNYKAIESRGICLIFDAPRNILFYY